MLGEETAEDSGYQPACLKPSRVSGMASQGPCQAEARTREEVLQKEKGGWDYLPDSERLRRSNEQDAFRNFEVLREAKAQGPHCKEVEYGKEGRSQKLGALG